MTIIAKNLGDKTAEITLKGSVDIVAEFFFTAINSILYQRGIYQPENFRREEKYGLTVLTTTDAGLLEYLKTVMDQVETWLQSGDVQKLVVVVAGIDSGETLERWQFNVCIEDEEGAVTKASINDENHQPQDNNILSSGDGSAKKSQAPKKTLKEIHNEIQAIIRQITASVTFLPLLTEPCAFDMLVYTKKDAAVPTIWKDSDPRYILNSQEVKLRSFTTSIHKIDSMVTYREADEWDL
mmetsp:Transcript_42261/g.62634  ORF Transcript_42261/g.62634 Transcript_42261/m.62634 type:complete len:239 (+) Transcript_42261:1582-2298(+)